MFALREINPMETGIVFLPAKRRIQRMVHGGFKGLGPYPAHYTALACSSGPFAHPRPSTNNNPTAIPFFGPSTPSSPSSTISLTPTEKSSRRSSADAYTVPPESQLPPACSSGPLARPKPSTNGSPMAVPSFGPGVPASPPSMTFSTPADKSSQRASANAYSVPPTPPASHSNVPSPVESMSLATPPNYEGDTKTVSPTGSNPMQISGDNVSLPYHHHIHTRKSSSPIPAHPKAQMAIDTKHTSPKKTSNVYQHAVKSNTVYAFARPCVW